VTKASGRVWFVLIVGLLVAVFAFRWITDPLPRAARVQEEQLVLASRNVLQRTTNLSGLEIVDPLDPQRKVGKVYVYPEGDGWAVSGFYRRDDTDRWHPYLMMLDNDLQLVTLKLKDNRLAELANNDPRLDAVN
jgi:hypothetical protein